MQIRTHYTTSTRTPRAWAALLIISIASFSPLLANHTSASNEVSRFYANTGFSVSYAFLRYFDTYGGVRLFGYPISDEMQENGRTVQYFERQKLEYFKEAAGTRNEVLGARMGEEFLRGKRILKARPFSSKSNLVFVRETQHSLSNSFLNFWRANGGVKVFGYPISEPMQEGGRLVQYFERARMEYHTDKAKQGQAVQLGLLGKEYVARHPEVASKIAVAKRVSPSARGGQPQPELERLETGEISAREWELLWMINDARRKAGLRPVALGGELSAIAQSRSNDMVSGNYFSHTTPDGGNFTQMLQGASISYAHVGEILANNNYAEGETTQQAFTAYMNSPRHKAIILDPRFTEAGLGQAKSSQGYYFFTVIFAQR